MKSFHKHSDLAILRQKDQLIVKIELQLFEHIIIELQLIVQLNLLIMQFL